MTLSIATVTDSISKLSVTNLTICDIDQIKVMTDKRLASLVPAPDFITDIDAQVDSFGSSTAKLTFYYTLTYRLFYQPLGRERSTKLEHISGLVAMIAAIWDAVLAIDTIAGCEHLAIQAISNFGVVEDPAGNAWWGCDLGFRAQEFVR